MKKIFSYFKREIIGQYKKNNLQSNYGFTLVEIVVVVSVLVILWTISFLSFGDNLVDSRNTQRMSDMWRLITWLKSSKQKNWSYPMPSKYFNIINSWSIQVYQWLIDNNISVSDINSIPKDPTVEKNYSYSITKNKQNFQIWLTLEGSANKKQTAAVDWDYKTISRNLFPSLILAWSFTWTVEIHDWIVTNGSTWSINRQYFVLNWWSYNLPYDFNTLLPATNWISVGYVWIISEPWVILWTNSSYKSCNEIYEDWKSMWIWEYQIVDINWNIINIICDWVESPLLIIIPCAFDFAYFDQCFIN